MKQIYVHGNDKIASDVYSLILGGMRVAAGVESGSWSD
jgi:hypothetical protein